MQAAEFLNMDRRQLAEALEQGHPIDPGALDDSEYRGVSLGLPGWIDRLAWKTFMKVFHRDPDSGHLRGWNVRLEQKGVDGPCVPKMRGDRPVTFGHFRVVEAADRPMPRPVQQGLLIDYGQGQHPPLDPTRRLRDPVVAVNSGSADLLLGWSYLEFGSIRVGTPSFFTLERVGALESGDRQ